MASNSQEPAPVEEPSVRGDSSADSTARVQGAARRRSSWWLPLIVVWGMALLWRLVATWGLDLGDVPGPAGAQIVLYSITGEAPGWDSKLLHVLIAMTGLSPLAAARLLVLGSGMLGILGTMLAGWALGGRVAALGAGLVAGAWSQHIFLSIMVGGDAPAGAAAWLGVGMCWCAMRLRWRGPPVALAGGALAVVGLGVKVTALPAVAFLLLVPFLFLWRRDSPWRLLTPIAALAGALAGRWWLISQFRMPETTGANSSLHPGHLVSGMQWIMNLEQHSGFDAAFPLLMAMALLGAILPGKLYLARLFLALLSGVVLCATAWSLGHHVCPRYLVFASFGLLVLAGFAVGGLAAWAGRLPPGSRRESSGPLRSAMRYCAGPCWASGASTYFNTPSTPDIQHGPSRYAPGAPRRGPSRLFRAASFPTAPGFRRFRVLGWLPAAALTAFLLLDSLAYLRAWSEQRSPLLGTAGATLPRPPSFFAHRYRMLGFDYTVSAVGALDMMEIPRKAPRGVAGVHLRDRREAHLELGAALAGVPSVIVRPTNCCTGRRSSRDCARRVLDQVEDAGLLLVLPDPAAHVPPQHSRVDGPDAPWAELLLEEAKSRAAPRSVSPWWLTWQFSGQGPLPCQKHGPGAQSP